MSYNANRYNYATPLSSVSNLTSRTSAVSDVKYFTLFDNSLDGSYRPITGDVGIWDSAVASSAGQLATPFVVTVNETRTIRSVVIVGSAYSYPVAFTISLYNGSSLLHTFTETSNNSVQCIVHLPRQYSITHYVLSITKVSAPGGAARLYSLQYPVNVDSQDTMLVSAIETSDAYQTITVKRADTLKLHRALSESSHVHNTIGATRDTLRLSAEDSRHLTNVHSIMKNPSRQVFGKVYITYTDPMLSSTTQVNAQSTAYNSDVSQVMDGVKVSDGRFFTLYENNLSGDYAVSGVDTQVGWVSGKLSGVNGYFSNPAPFIRIDIAPRPVTGLPITFEDSYGAVAENFTVEFIQTGGTSVTKTFVGNTEPSVTIPDSIANVEAIVITVTKVAKAGYPVAIVEVPIASTLLYTGYQDSSDLISIDLLEELTYDDEVEALGGISANEITVVLDNSNRDFYFNNQNSLVASSLKRNRKIEPWLGTEVVPGTIEWYSLGTFWSYKWDVPVEGLTATVVGFDTIGLLDTSSFTNHQTLLNKSLGELIEYVLDDARTQFDFIEYVIDPALYDIVVPYAWFEAGSHTAALRRISGCYPMHIYCDRAGRICAAPQKLRLDFYYDTWSDSTNVMSKNYSSLYTTLPNIINVTVSNPVVVTSEELAKDELVFNVAQIPSRTLNFSKPYLSGISVSVDCDAAVRYTYAVYSWGITLTFSGTGNVRSITCTGNAVDNGHTAVITKGDADSIKYNGAVTRDIQSDFIQTVSLANILIDRILGLSEYDKYDASVEYRGDIALSINDPILLLNGIAPDNRYNIKRHQLHWNGSLHGSADLNT